MGLLDQSVIDDFGMLVAAAGHDPRDFYLSSAQDPPDPGSRAVRGYITVTRKSNGFSRRYPTEQGNVDWLLAFDDDLRRGAFGASGL